MNEQDLSRRIFSLGPSRMFVSRLPQLIYWTQNSVKIDSYTSIPTPNRQAVACPPADSGALVRCLLSSNVSGFACTIPTPAP